MNRLPKNAERLKKALFVSTGFVSLVLGIFGAVLPVLPATPFLLLSLYCFSKSSEKLSEGFKRTWLYKKYLSGYDGNKTMTLRQKIFIQLLAGTMMTVSFVLSGNFALRIILVICFIAHNAVFILRYRPPGNRRKNS